MFYYTVFGLKVTSEIEMDELPPASFEKADVRVIRQKGLAAMPLEGSAYVLNEKMFFLRRNGIASFRVTHGELIEVDEEAGSILEEVKLFLLGSCMGVLLHQRGIVPLHGSVVKVAESGVLLTGHSGAGKSTTANAFIERGYALVTDDIAAVRLGDGPFVEAAYGSQKLWEDVLERTSVGERRRVNRTVDGRNKYSVTRPDVFSASGVPLQVIVELVPCEEASIRMEEVSGLAVIPLLTMHTYRGAFVKMLKREEEHFQRLVQIAGGVRVFRVYRPIGEPVEHEVCELILTRVKECVR